MVPIYTYKVSKLLSTILCPFSNWRVCPLIVCFSKDWITVSKTSHVSCSCLNAKTDPHAYWFKYLSRDHAENCFQQPPASVRCFHWWDGISSGIGFNASVWVCAGMLASKLETDNIKILLPCTPSCGMALLLKMMTRTPWCQWLQLHAEVFHRFQSVETCCWWYTIVSGRLFATAAPSASSQAADLPPGFIARLKNPRWLLCHLPSLTFGWVLRHHGNNLLVSFLRVQGSTEAFNATCYPFTRPSVPIYWLIWMVCQGGKSLPTGRDKLLYSGDVGPPAEVGSVYRPVYFLALFIIARKTFFRLTINRVISSPKSTPTFMWHWLRKKFLCFGYTPNVSLGYSQSPVAWLGHEGHLLSQPPHCHDWVQGVGYVSQSLVDPASILDVICNKLEEEQPTTSIWGSN